MTVAICVIMNLKMQNKWILKIVIFEYCFDQNKKILLDSTFTKKTVSRKEYLFKCQLILFKFIGALVDQIYDIFMIVSLILINQNILALLFFLTDFVPGLFTVWQKYLSENKTWRKSYLLLLCHPVNMIVWPLIIFFYPSEKNKNQLEVFSILSKY